MSEKRGYPEMTEAFHTRIVQTLDTLEDTKVKKRRFVFRAGMAAVCALAVFIGGVKYFGNDSDAEGLGIGNAFGLYAYAAETGELIEPIGSRIFFEAANGGSAGEKTGFYSGILLRITGEDIKTVEAEINKGEFYRYEEIPFNRDELEEMSDEELLALYEGTDERTRGADNIDAYSTDLESKIEYICPQYRIGNHFIEEYNPDYNYGLWAEAYDEGSDEDVQAYFHGLTDTFDGATMVITVTFSNGAKESKTLSLHTGKLAVDFDENGSYYTGELAEEGEPYMYGVYADIQ